MKASLSRPSSSTTTTTRRFTSNVTAARPYPRCVASRFLRSSPLLNASPRLEASHWRICAAAEDEVEIGDEIEEEEAVIEEGRVESLFAEGEEDIYLEKDDEDDYYSDDDDERGERRPKTPGGFEERVVELRRVSSTKKGGRKMRFRAVMVVGNGLGTVGIGNATANEIPAACIKAAMRARKELITFDLNEESRSFPHRQEAKICASKVVLVPAADGTGVVAGGVIRTVFEVAGVKNGFGKILNSGNAMNNAKATVKALEMMRTLPEVAEMRGVSLDYMLGRTVDPEHSAYPPSCEEEAAEEGEAVDVTGNT